MKKSVLVVLIVLCAILLASCCKHEAWNNADCENPITCAECGKTQGTPLGHKWTDANCEAPKTCSVCAKTEGEALGHAWEDATTEAPKTCSVCANTEGERIITDPRFTTAACKPLFGRWVYTMRAGADMLELEGFTGYLDVNIYMEFFNDGKVVMSVDAEECADFDTLLIQYLVDQFYTACAAEGINKAAADAEMVASLGMTTEEYFKTVANSVDFSAMFEALSEEGVYYVSGDTLYTSDEWKKNMEENPFRLDGDKLFLDTLMQELGVESGNFTRVPDSES